MCYAAIGRGPLARFQLGYDSNSDIRLSALQAFRRADGGSSLCLESPFLFAYAKRHGWHLSAGSVGGEMH